MEKLRRQLFYIGTFLIILQKCPPVLETKYELFRIIIYGLFAFLLAISFPKIIKVKIKKLMVAVCIFCFLQLILFLIMELFGLFINWEDLVEIAIPISIILIGASFNFSEEDLVRISLFFIMLTLVVSFWQIYYFQRNFFIQESYTIPIKNSMGPFLVISNAILLYYLLFYSRGKNNSALVKIIYSAIIIFGFYLSLVIRSRSSILAFLLYFAILLIKKHRYLQLSAVLILMVLLIIIPGLKLKDYIIKPVLDSFTLNYYPYDLENISAGRLSVFKDAIWVIKEEPLFGLSMMRYDFRGTPHNYLVNKMVRYGIFGSISFIIIYILFGIFCLKHIIFRKPAIENLGVFLFIIPFIISFFEYTYPFGPGTANFMVFLMFSTAVKVRRHKELKHEDSSCCPTL